METSPRHARNSRRQRNKCPHHRQQTSDEDCKITPTVKEPVSPIQFVIAKQNPASIFLDQRTASIVANFVSDQ